MKNSRKFPGNEKNSRELPGTEFYGNSRERSPRLKSPRSPWNEESCPNDVENFVFAHFKNKMVTSDLMHIFKSGFEALENEAGRDQAKWDHDIETLINVGFQAVFDEIKPQDVCDFTAVFKEKYEL